MSLAVKKIAGLKHIDIERTFLVLFGFIGSTFSYVLSRLITESLICPPEPLLF